MNSRRAVFLILMVYAIVRWVSFDRSDLHNNMFTDSDGLGYYMYLPGVFIYKDITAYEWLPAINEKYKVYGGKTAFQISKHSNGNYVTNYLGGVAIMQAPFFFLGHGVASISDYPADGFSPPYQMAIGIAPLFYFILCLFLLRTILLRYYDDRVVAVTLILGFLASNAVEYIGIEAGQSHGYVMVLYVLILYFTIQWHEKPRAILALLIGGTIGWASIMRPTELIMVLIPILWSTQSKVEKKKKWKLVRDYKSHWLWAIFGGILGGVLQVIYWKYVTGDLINTVGSKWRFLDPYWRVLVGWEKGWFIYTPITILFVFGLFFMPKKPFFKSVIWFCGINIWIIISWNNWRYGGSYSTRALVQSYPVFMFAFAAAVEKILSGKWRIWFYGLGIYLIGVNLFQVWQYRKNILHFDDMNRAYYQAIYLDKDPTPLDMSLLDGGVKKPGNTEDCKSLYTATEMSSKDIESNGIHIDLDVDEFSWVSLRMDLLVHNGYWDGKIQVKINEEATTIAEKNFRTFHALTKHKEWNTYHMEVPIGLRNTSLDVHFLGSNFKAAIKDLEIEICH